MWGRCRLPDAPHLCARRYCLTYIEMRGKKTKMFTLWALEAKRRVILGSTQEFVERSNRIHAIMAKYKVK